MNNAENTDHSQAICKVKGYRYGFLNLLGILFVFFSALSFFIVYDNKNNVSAQTLVTTGVVCGVVAALAIGLVIYDRVTSHQIKNKDCVILFEDGITFFADKPKAEKGYKRFSFDELLDYGFINIIRKGSGESRLLFSEKRRSSSTYLYADLMNYGYMRITTKDGGYYNVPVDDIQTVRDFMKNHAPQVEEFVYMRIAGIHDDVIINLK